MHNIIGLRKFTDRSGKERVTEKFSDKGWRALDIREALNSKELLNLIPPAERYNLFYTVNHVFEGKGRQFERGYVLAWDIDKIPGYTVAHAERIARLVAAAIGADYEKLGVVSSGNGVHILLRLIEEKSWTDPHYFEAMRLAYKGTCERINIELKKAGFPGAKADTAIFDTARVLRLPGTTNRKPERPDTECVLIRGDILPQDFSLLDSAGMETMAPEDTLTAAQTRLFPAPDTEAILAGCEFLRWGHENPAEVTEPQWYAGLSILGRISKDPSESRKLAHAYSSGHPGYSHDETELKIEQALACGPRTCQSIHATWTNSKCRECPNWGKISSPIMIQGADFIRTKETGFHFVYPDPKNPAKIKVGKPDYEGLRRWFNKQHEYMSLANKGGVFVWNKKTWDEIYEIEIKNFAAKSFNPLADSNMSNEFFNIIRRNNVRRNEWFHETTVRKMNFQNGILDLETMNFSEHTSKCGFRQVLPYNYDPEAKCPRFEQYLDEIMLGRDELKNILLEFSGYSLSNDDYWEHKALVLQGDGRNGKSTFVDLLKNLVGKGLYSSMNLADLSNDQNRFSLDGALFNISEETPGRSLADSSLFKNLTAGGEVQIKQVYAQPYTIENRAKMWLLCNEIPKTNDMTTGMFRRLVIIPFDASFSEETKVDKFIKQKLLLESPGILNLMLKAYKRMKENGGLSYSRIVKDKIEEYGLESDSASRWWKEFITVGPIESGDFAPCEEVYSSYKIQMETDGERPLTKTAFFKRISLSIQKDYKERATRRSINNEDQRIIKGVKLTKGSNF